MSNRMGPSTVQGEVGVTSAAGVATLDCSKGSMFRISLSEDITSLAASNFKQGQLIGVAFIQDAVARTVTPDGTSVAYKGGATAIPQGAAAGGTTTIVCGAYGGTLQVLGTVVGA